jgi:hypothetical protein
VEEKNCNWRDSQSVVRYPSLTTYCTRTLCAEIKTYKTLSSSNDPHTQANYEGIFRRTTKKRKRHNGVATNRTHKWMGIPKKRQQMRCNHDNILFGTILFSPGIAPITINEPHAPPREPASPLVHLTLHSRLQRLPRHARAQPPHSSRAYEGEGRQVR